MLKSSQLTWFFVFCFIVIAMPTMASAVIEATFSNLYPDPWWQTGWGVAIISIGVAIATAAAIAFTVATAGVGGAMLGAAGSWITGVGSMVGMAAGYGSGAAAAGLAILGGGTLASGGFGIAGGAFVVAALTGAATGVVTDLSLNIATDIIAKEPYRRYEFIKVPMIEKHGTEEIKDFVYELKKLEEDLSEEKIDSKYFADETKKVSNRLIAYFNVNTCNESIDNEEEILYDSINASILFFNLGMSEKSQKCISKVSLYSENASFLSYLAALNNLAQNKYLEAFKDLDIAIAREPDALQPYILYTMALFDRKDYEKALKISKDGLNNVSKKNYQLLYTAGESSFYLNRYVSAAEFFERAYSNISEDLIEADTAMMVAVSYHKAGDNEKGWKWYQTALKKVEDHDENYKKEITKRWNDFIE